MKGITIGRKDILSQAERWHKQQIAWRQRFHQYPELSFQEHSTTSFIRDEIKKLGLKILPISMETGVLAELNSNTAGRTVAIRTDIDALPITEQTDLAFKSRNEGCMHACGHDMHMATVMGAAAILAEMPETVKGNVRFIFQPGEEQPPGGARPMIEEGALENVDAIFGLHVDPHLPTGRISVRDGAAMASVYDFDITIKGRGGHAARPQTAVDAIATAAEVVESVQKIISREVDPISPVAITFGKIEGGTARNVIADSVKLTGTARALSVEAGRKIPRLLKRTVAGICKARGADFELDEIAGYPVLSNDASVNELYERNFQFLFGKKKVDLTEPVLGGEDFACYLEKVPGAMFRLGIQNKKIGADKPWHASDFIADEKALVYGTALLVACTLDFLATNSE